MTRNPFKPWDEVENSEGVWLVREIIDNDTFKADLISAFPNQFGITPAPDHLARLAGLHRHVSNYKRRPGTDAHKILLEFCKSLE